MTESKCWICGRTNADIRREIPNLAKNSSMINEHGGINGKQMHCCYPCEHIIKNIAGEYRGSNVKY